MAVPAWTIDFPASRMHLVNPSSLKPNYDYLIVGSGPSGSMLANQLQSIGSVLVIEAGSEHAGPLSKIPAFYPRSFGSRIDWNYQIQPQSQLASRKLAWPSGRTIGGSSAINAMIRIEPSDSCLEELHAMGGGLWTKNSIRAIFLNLRDVWQGSLPELHSNTARLLDQAITLGYGSHDAMVSPCSILAPYVRMQAAGRRISSGRLMRCDILTRALARKITIQSDRALGVVVDVDKERLELNASKQIILCCGAVQTPRLLFQSGIGPKDTLAHAGLVCTHHHDRIGTGLRDHLVYPIIFKLRAGSAFSWPLDRSDRLKYIQNQDGPKSSNLAELGAFIDPTGNTPQSFQWHITPTHYLAYPNISIQQPCISIGITQCKPQSHGSVMPDAIDPGYLTDTKDWPAFLQAIRWSRDFFHQQGWSDLLEHEMLPGFKRQSDEAIRSHFERFVTTLYHYSGSCAMGADPAAPVDPQFKFRHIDRLRICDASVLPNILGCNPQTTLMMMAIRLAGWLAEEF